MALLADKNEYKKKLVEYLKKKPKDSTQIELIILQQIRLIDPRDPGTWLNLAQKYYSCKYYDICLQILDQFESEVKNKIIIDAPFYVMLNALRALSKLNTYKLDNLLNEFKSLRDYIKSNNLSCDPELLKQINSAIEKDIPELENNANIKVKNEEKMIEEIRIVQNLLEKFEIPQSPDKIVYLLSVNWFTKWKKYINYHQYANDTSDHINFMEEDTISYNYLGPIDQNDILDTDEELLIDLDPSENYTNTIIKYGLIENKNFMMISPELWEYFQSRYGGISIPRYTIWRTDEENEIQVEIWLQRINVLIFTQETLISKKNIEQSAVDRVYISKNKTIKELCKKLQGIYSEFYSINNNECRIWKLDPTIDPKIAVSLALSIKNSNKPGQINAKILLPNTKIKDAEIGIDDTIIFEIKFGLSWLLFNQSEEQIPKKIDGLNSTLTNLATNTVKLSKTDEATIAKLMNFFGITRKQYSSSSKRGLTGLQNLGNTCFMNSALQCLSNTYDLTEYFITDKFVRDLNIKNPIGTGGYLAVYYAELLKEIWYGNSQYVSPWQLKKTIGKMASQFVGYGQQDSQELLSYLLDGLHEDLNRVLNKPIVETIESDNKEDEKVAIKSWENHLKRNQSIIQELMHGQYKSTLVCPDCKRISITFDPYMMLSLPIPHLEYSKFFLYFISENHKQLPTKINFNIPKNTSSNEIKTQLSKLIGVKENNIVMALLKEHKLVEFVGESADAYYLKEHSGIPFAYQISLYDEEKMINENEKQFLIKVFISAEPKNFYESDKLISYTRLILADTSVTYQELHIKVYEKMRHHIVNYFNKSGKKSIINLEDKSYQRLITEYKELFQDENEQNWIYKLYLINSYKDDIKNGKKPICPLCDKKCKSCILPYEDKKLIDYCTKMSVPISEIILDVKFTKPIKLELLGLNSCQEHNGSTESNDNQNKEYSIYDCLRLFTRTERLEKENAWYCSHCKDHKQATKKMEIYKAPQILIIHLKRFRTSRVSSFGSYYFASGSQKLSAMVDFPINSLDLTDYVLGKDNNSKLYDLYAVSNHYGSLSGGHYTAYCKNHSEKKWYDFNDSRVSVTNEKQVISSAAYVLFYKRRKQGKKQNKIFYITLYYAHLNLYEKKKRYTQYIHRQP